MIRIHTFLAGVAIFGWSAAAPAGEPSEDNTVAFLRAGGDAASPFAGGEGTLFLIGAGVVLLVVAGLLFGVHRIHRRANQALTDIESLLEEQENKDE